EGFMLGFELYRGGPLAELARLVWPSARVLARRGLVDAAIRRSCGSGYHPCGTAPMGPDGDPLAVVDPQGRGRGAEAPYRRASAVPSAHLSSLPPAWPASRACPASAQLSIRPPPSPLAPLLSRGVRGRPVVLPAAPALSAAPRGAPGGPKPVSPPP